MSRVNGGARLSYVRLGLTVRQVTPNAVLVSQGPGNQTAEVWIPRVCLSWQSERVIDSQLQLPVYCANIEVVQWKATALRFTLS